MNSVNLQEVRGCLAELKEEHDVSKTFKEKIGKVMTLLEGESELVVEKAILALEELSSLELSSYHRTRVWDAISLLESVKS